jgi:hypothetical protein
MISYDSLIGRYHFTVAVAVAEGSKTYAYADGGQGLRDLRVFLHRTRFMVRYHIL